MLNRLPLIMVVILSLFLAFYCVDSHKENILTILNIDKKNNMESISLKVEENLTRKTIKSIKPIEKLYVEVLAIDNKNESNKTVDKIKSTSETVIDEVLSIELETEIENTEPIKKVETLKGHKTQIISEYSKDYKLDDLEKMVLEELKKGNED